MASLREAQERYARHYLALVERAEPHLTGAEQEVWLGRLELEHENLRAVLRWAQADGGQGVGLQLASAVWRFWQVRGSLGEGRRWLEGLLTSVGTKEIPGGAPVRAKALSGSGSLAYRQGDYARARALHEEGLALFRGLGDRQGIADSLNNLGFVAWAQGDYARARALHDEGLALFRGLGDRRGIATSLNNLGLVVTDQGDYARAILVYGESLTLFRESNDKGGIAIALDNLGNVNLYLGNDARAVELHEESLALRRELGDKRGIANSLINLGNVTYALGDLPRATAFLDESLVMYRELGDAWGVAYSLHNLGGVAHEQGDLAKATALYEESLALLRELGDKRGIAYSLEGLASAAGVPGNEHGALERAARLFGAAAALRAAISAPMAPNERVAYDRAVETARTSLGDGAFAAGWAAGQALTPEQAIALALGEPSPA
jgi:tetratricopeptide (TPR) repeat protein